MRKNFGEERDPVRPKVAAATGGAGVGVSVGEILVHVIERITGDLPIHVEVAVVVVASATLAFVAGYLKAE